MTGVVVLDDQLVQAVERALVDLETCDGLRCSAAPSWSLLGPCGCAVGLCDVCRCLFESWLVMHPMVRCGCGRRGMTGSTFRWEAL